MRLFRSPHSRCLGSCRRKRIAYSILYYYIASLLKIPSLYSNDEILEDKVILCQWQFGRGWGITKNAISLDLVGLRIDYLVSLRSSGNIPVILGIASFNFISFLVIFRQFLTASGLFLIPYPAILPTCQLSTSSRHTIINGSLADPDY
jgi:hypothetical protein